MSHKGQTALTGYWYDTLTQRKPFASPYFFLSVNSIHSTTTSYPTRKKTSYRTYLFIKSNLFINMNVIDKYKL